MYICNIIMWLICVNMEVNDVIMKDIYGDMWVSFVGMRFFNVNMWVMIMLICKLFSMLL